MLGFHRVWASPDRVMWSRGYDHFVMRQAKDGISYGPGALWLAVSAESRAQVDQVHAEMRDAGAEILQPPKELDYFAPGYYSVAFRDPDGVPIEVAHRWDELPDLADAELVKVPGHGVTLGGYFFKPQAGKPPYPAVILLHGFAGHASQLAGAGARSPRPTATPRWRCRCAAGWARRARATRACASRSTCWRRSTGWPSGRWSTASGSALVGASMGGQVALLAAAHKPPIRAVASFFAPTDLARWREANPFVRDYLDDLCGPEGLPVRSPILRVAQIDVPVLLIHGDSDENVSVRANRRHGRGAARATARTSRPSSCPAPPTIFTEQQNADARRKLFDFLRRHLNRS